MARRIKVLVIDDSILAREMITEGLSRDPEIFVSAAAKDPYEARDMINMDKPDVITLDVELPRMSGVEFLRKIMSQNPIPVIMVSAFTENGALVTIEALDSGAVDFVTKPSGIKSYGFDEMIKELITKIKIASFANFSSLKKTVKEENSNYKRDLKKLDKENSIIAIGASTGGTEAIRDLILNFNSDTPGILVVQHMPAGFTKAYAERLNEQTPLNVKEAEDGDIVKKGSAYIAPGGLQMRVSKSSLGFLISVRKEAPVNRHAPSVDVLFDSVAKNIGENAIGVILTGMGKDGAEGLLRMHLKGARTFSQDEKTSLIYGMPKAAVDIGAVDKTANLKEIYLEIINLLN